jgi:hypothetical protein
MPFTTTLIQKNLRPLINNNHSPQYTKIEDTKKLMYYKPTKTLISPSACWGSGWDALEPCLLNFVFSG